MRSVRSEYGKESRLPRDRPSLVDRWPQLVRHAQRLQCCAESSLREFRDRS
jgi:hypothetical protein